MNSALVDPVRHHLWATRQLLPSCKQLSGEQLSATSTGTYGGILPTLNHLVGADSSYLKVLSGETAWQADNFDDVGLDELESRVDATERVWEHFLANPFDAEHILLMDQGTYECPSGVVFAQALHHGTLHREQICSILTSVGRTAPDLQPWAYADATGRGRVLGR